MAQLNYRYDLFHDNPVDTHSFFDFDELDFTRLSGTFADGSVTDFTATMEQNIDDIAVVGSLGGAVADSLVGQYNDATHQIWWHHLRPGPTGLVLDQTLFSGHTINSADNVRVMAMSGTFHRYRTRLLLPGEPDPDGQQMVTTDISLGLWTASVREDPDRGRNLLATLDREAAILQILPRFIGG